MPEQADCFTAHSGDLDSGFTVSDPETVPDTLNLFRPSLGSKVELVWRDRRDDNLRQQTIQLPEFSPDVKNWYCYFTLNENQEWTAVFEGTLDEEIDH